MKIKKGLELRQINSKSYVLESVETGVTLQKMISFNSTAAFLWTSIKGKDFTAEDIALLLQDKYSISKETALADSNDIIQAWIKADIIEQN